MKITSIIVSIILITAAISFSNSRFTDNGNGIVTDSNTGFFWQKCSAGLSGKDCTTGKAKEMTWNEADSYCKDISLGGRQNWRIPTVEELSRIIDNENKKPKINITFFPGTPPAFYWTSSVYEDVNVGSSDNMYFVSFFYGSAGFSTKATNYHVRCISGR